MDKILIINNAEPGLSEFTNPVKGILSDYYSQSEVIEYADSRRINLNLFNGIILSGSPQGDDIVEHHLPYFQWIKEYKKPIFGICAGHHLVGALYGSELYRNLEPESGESAIDILKDDPLTQGLSKKLKVQQMHNDSISLPNGFVLLASSSICKNQMMKHKYKPIYTCQFHPEYYNPELFKNFIAITKSQHIPKKQKAHP